MGVKGRKPNRSTEKPIVLDKRKREVKDNKHRALCLLAAKWLRKNKLNAPVCPYVAVELVTAAKETPDVFGWNYWATVLIEVKVSRSDFLADAKKWVRQFPQKGMGAFRYYCCPECLITEEDLPENWGLLWSNENGIRLIKEATRQTACDTSEVGFLTSIMRRESIKPQIFNYRKT